MSAPRRQAQGKWADPCVPKRGWTCTAISDAESDTRTCEMCEMQEIRFIHRMTHPDHSVSLKCGCVCAGHMEGDPTRARERDDRARALFRRRRAWLLKPGWRLTDTGVRVLRGRGYDVKVFSVQDHWSATITFGVERRWMRLRLRHPTHRSAALAAFDFLEHVKATARGRPVARAAPLFPVDR